MACVNSVKYGQGRVRGCTETLESEHAELHVRLIEAHCFKIFHDGGQLLEDRILGEH
jgi:hypothetical protein